MKISVDRDAAAAVRIWKWSGLQVYEASAEGGASAVPQLLVPVVQQRALQVLSGPAVPLKQRRPKGIREWEGTALPMERDPFARRAARLAVRAVYALGLDQGVVRMLRTGGGYPSLLEVDPDGEHHRLFGRMVRRAVDEEMGLAETESRRLEDGLDVEKQAFKMGADPEYVLCTPEGKVLPASHFLPRRGRAGSDAVRLPGGEVAYMLAELRPAPAATPAELMRSLLASLRRAAAMIGDNGLQWRAGGMPAPGLPLGGHLHFSGRRLNNALLRVLDNYLALPLVLVEEDGARQRRPRYGFLGDARVKAHGGFEYRTLPSWLQAPLLAMSVFALARLIADNYERLTLLPLQDERVLQAYYAGDKHALLPAFQTVWPLLEELPEYGLYRSCLDPLKRRMLEMRGWDEQSDIRPRWRI